MRIGPVGWAFDTIEETASYAKARRIAKVITVENGAVKEETI